MKILIIVLLISTLSLSYTFDDIDVDYIFDKYDVAKSSKSNKGWIRLLKNEKKIIKKFGKKIEPYELNQLNIYFTAKLERKKLNVGVLR